MPARNTLEHSDRYREDHQEEHVSESAKLKYSVENQEDWSRSDPGIRFTDELNKVSEKAATAFNNGQSLAEYSDEEVNHIVESYLTAWNTLDFATQTERKDAAEALAHKIFEPMMEQQDYDQSHLDAAAINRLPQEEQRKVNYLMGNDTNGEQSQFHYTMEPVNTQVMYQAYAEPYMVARHEYATLAYAEITRTKDDFAEALYNSTADNYEDTAQHLKSLTSNAVERYNGLSDPDPLTTHANEYSRNLYLDLSAPAGWNNTNNAIATMYGTDPATAHTATKVAEQLMAQYRPTLEEALINEDETAFEDTKNKVIEFDTTFAQTLATGEPFIKGENYTPPDLPSDFPDFDTALNYIKEVDQINQRIESNELETNTTYKIALTDLSQKFTSDLHIVEDLAKANDYPDPNYLQSLHRGAKNIDFLLRPADTKEAVTAA